MLLTTAVQTLIPHVHLTASIFLVYAQCVLVSFANTTLDWSAGVRPMVVEHPIKPQVDTAALRPTEAQLNLGSFA